MKIYAIIAHDRKDSLCQHIFEQLVQSYRAQGHEVDVLDLYERYQDIPFYFSTKLSAGAAPLLGDYPFFTENKERFMAADRLLIVFPVYWYSVPGILKCWIDLITNFAWQYEGGRYAKPLHHIQKVFAVNTADLKWYHRWFALPPASRQIRETFCWMGVPHVRCVAIENLNAASSSDIKQCAQDVVQQGQWLCV